MILTAIEMQMFKGKLVQDGFSATGNPLQANDVLCLIESHEEMREHVKQLFIAANNRLELTIDQVKFYQELLKEPTSDTTSGSI